MGYKVFQAPPSQKRYDRAKQRKKRVSMNEVQAVMMWHPMNE